MTQTLMLKKKIVHHALWRHYTKRCFWDLDDRRSRKAYDVRFNGRVGIGTTRVQFSKNSQRHVCRQRELFVFVLFIVIVVVVRGIVGSCVTRVVGFVVDIGGGGWRMFLRGGTLVVFGQDGFELVWMVVMVVVANNTLRRVVPYVRAHGIKA